MAKKQPSLSVEMVQADTLVPYARNTRKHPADQIASLRSSIREFGFVNPILVDANLGIIAGHARLKAAQAEGIAEVPVIRLGHLTEAQRRAYVIADNRLAELAEWDADMLRVEVADIVSDGIDLDSIGFDDESLREILGDDPTAGLGGEGGGEEDDADDEIPAAPEVVTSVPGDMWLMGDHRLICGDSTDPAVVAAVMGEDRAALLFTSPPYGQQREYKTGGIGDWDALMRGVFQSGCAAMAAGGQVLVNLGLIHREGEWQPYWSGWLDWMRAQGWRRFGLYAWDQGPGLPGDWNGRLAPAFEFVFHFNRQARAANKIVPCKWAGTPNKGSGLRAADGTISEYQHAGLPVQEMRIPDSVLRITRHKARGVETEHPAVFPVALPEFLMRAYTDEGDVVFEPFSGAGTSILAAERAGRRARAVELAPAYVDLTIARWSAAYPEAPVTLAATGQRYEEVAAERGADGVKARRAKRGR